jgi:membrane protein
MAIVYIVRDSFLSFRKDGCLNLSAAIAFFAILSLIPFIYLIVSLVGFFAGSEGEILPKVTSYIEHLIPFYSVVVIKEVARINLGSGIFAWFAFFFMLWSSTLIFDSIEFSLKIVFKVHNGRSFWVSKIMSLLFVPVAGLVFLFLQIFNLLMDGFLRLSFHLGIKIIPHFLHGVVISYILPFFFTFILLSGLYVLVSPGKMYIRETLAGGFICTVMLEAAKYIFGWMIKYNPNFGLVYGSLNTVIIMILWIFYASAIFLFCAEIISASRKSRKRSRG